MLFILFRIESRHKIFLIKRFILFYFQSCCVFSVFLPINWCWFYIIYHDVKFHLIFDFLLFLFHFFEFVKWLIALDLRGRFIHLLFSYFDPFSTSYYLLYHRISSYIIDDLAFDFIYQTKIDHQIDTQKINQHVNSVFLLILMMFDSNYLYLSFRFPLL